MPAPPTRRCWPPGCADTGASRPACTGSATSSLAKTTARFAPATDRRTLPACAPWRSTPSDWPGISTSPPACDNTPEHRCCRWPPWASCDDFAEALSEHPGQQRLDAGHVLLVSVGVGGQPVQIQAVEEELAGRGGDQRRTPVGPLHLVQSGVHC